jgi:hypothetical protein
MPHIRHFARRSKHKHKNNLIAIACSFISMWKLTEDPEEARGQLDESAGEVFLWNQPEYLSDDSYGTGESRAGSGMGECFSSIL